MIEIPDAKRRRIDSAMLESLATSFKMRADGLPFMHSFNDTDVAEMLKRSAEIVRPAIRSPRPPMTDDGEAQ